MAMITKIKKLLRYYNNFWQHCIEYLILYQPKSKWRTISQATIINYELLRRLSFNKFNRYSIQLNILHTIFQKNTFI